MLTFNATIRLTRPGQGTVAALEVYTARRVDWTYHPTTIEPLDRPAGMPLLAMVGDVPGADYRRGDILEILSFDGHGTALPTTTHFRVGLVELEPPPLLEVHAFLHGTDR